MAGPEPARCAWAGRPCRNRIPPSAKARPRAGSRRHAGAPRAAPAHPPADRSRPTRARSCPGAELALPMSVIPNGASPGLQHPPRS
ncbi:MAG: hypothetical protein ACK559_17065 [bacterium]